MIVAAVACQVSPGKITSSPTPTPKASNANCKVMVPFTVQIEYFVPVNSANNLLTITNFLFGSFIQNAKSS